MTRLESPLKRELVIKGRSYRLTISPLGLQLARKGRRNGWELSWLDFVQGDAALAKALNASLDAAALRAQPARPRRRAAAPQHRRSADKPS